MEAQKNACKRMYVREMEGMTGIELGSGLEKRDLK